jgi:RNA polymerase sigma-70 factor (ECF subfamily)
MIMPATAPTLSAVSPENAGALHAAVRRFIGARVRDAATADDLTQEVFVKVQKRIAQVRDPRRLMGWMIQIARNTVADHFRAAKATEPFKEEHVASDPTPPESHEREEFRLREELSAYVRSVVQGLSPIYRDAIVLTEYDGLSQVELARHLRLSVSAAKSRVQRARALVRETIDRCCHFEVDRYGAVVDCTPREKRCVCDVKHRHSGRVR